jgi:hypothetical protein
MTPLVRLAALWHCLFGFLGFLGMEEEEGARCRGRRFASSGSLEVGQKEERHTRNSKVESLLVARSFHSKAS